LLAVYDGSDNLLMRFEYADSRMPVAMTSSGGTYYLTYDQVGSLRLVADAAGIVVKSITYDSFGNIIDDTNPALEVPFGFAGGLHDRETGLVRFGYRDYDPDVGRWTAKDPIFFEGGDTDLYGYVLNDPINLIDYLGLWSIWRGASGIATGGPWGINAGSGIAYDSENGGLGIYMTEGESIGTGLSVGIEEGFFTGSMSGEIDAVTYGFEMFSVSFLSNVEGDWGFAFGGSIGYPIEGTISKNSTAFLSFTELIDALSGSESDPCE
jgi:RHS repeat-associated protein